MDPLLSVRHEVGEFRRRYKWMALFAVVVFAVLFGRLVQLQVIEQAKYKQMARENITRTIVLPASRGVLRDTRGNAVATNRPSYNVYITPSVVDMHDTLSRFAELIGLNAEHLKRLRNDIAKVPARRRTHRIQMYADITRDQLAALTTHSAELRGIDVVDQPVRMYQFGKLAAHAIGYLNEVSADDLKILRSRGYRPGDLVGRSGIERAFESVLRGVYGYRRISVDARGHQRDLADKEVIEKTKDPVPGTDLTLTLDMALMKNVERAFRNHPSGALVAVDAQTGRIRALYSKPSYDLNEFTHRLSLARKNELERDPFYPLIDKTIYATYYPGSIFKPFSAATALQDNVMHADTTVECTGQYELGNRKFRCTQKHGVVDMRQALTRSCNVYFYRLGELVGLDRLAFYARDFGFGERTGVGINTESKGFIDTRAWFEKQGQRFRAGYALNAAIGQGNTKISLIQAAMAYAALANGGRLYVPQLIEEMRAPDGRVTQRLTPKLRRQVSVSAEHLQAIREGLLGVVNNDLGTAYEARIAGGVSVVGKTGTAQVVHNTSAHKNNPALEEFFSRDHAWFAGFAPAVNPDLVVVVLVEHGGGGGKYAAPIAVEVLNDYLGADVAPPTD